VLVLIALLVRMGPVVSLAEPALGIPPTLNADSLQHDLERVRGEHKIPALAVLIMDPSGVLWQGAAGKRQQTFSDAVTIHDHWHLGSCTKAMTATLAARLIERGSLEWTTTLGEAIPDLRASMKPDWEGVTLRQLLSHTAGIVKEPSDGPLWPEMRVWDDAGRSMRDQRRAITRWLVEQSLGESPGTSMKYSNAGYLIAGHMLESIADRAWEDLIREEVFTPLGITSAGFGPPGSAQSVDQPRGHTGGGGFWIPRAPGPSADNPRALGPAGLVHMSLADWARFARLHALGGSDAFINVADDAPAMRAFLKPETIRFLHEPAPGSRAKDQPDGEGYALGWGVTRRAWAKGGGPSDVGLVLTHNGSNTLWLSSVWIAPERGLVVLGAANASPNDAHPAIDAAITLLIKAIDARP
jgi:CubicO group peptidase (beta-lactamase class C family)